MPPVNSIPSAFPPVGELNSPPSTRPSDNGLALFLGVFGLCYFSTALIHSVVHEAGHAIVGAVVGVNIDSIRLGPEAPAAAALRMPGVAVRVTGVPMEGRTFGRISAESLAERRRDEMWFLAGGPAAQCVLGTVLVLSGIYLCKVSWRASRRWRVPAACCIGIGLALFLFGIGSLDGTSHGDGYRLRALLSAGYSPQAGM